MRAVDDIESGQTQEKTQNSFPYKTLPSCLPLVFPSAIFYYSTCVTCLKVTSLLFFINHFYFLVILHHHLTTTSVVVVNPLSFITMTTVGLLNNSIGMTFMKRADAKKIRDQAMVRCPQYKMCIIIMIQL